MRATAALLLAVTISGALLTPASAATEQDAGIGLRLVDGPEGDVGGLAADRISQVIPAGGSQRWTVEVVNATPDPLVIPLTVGAADLADGQFRPADDAPDAELPDWVTIDPASPTVPAGGRAEATVTIDVPDDATDGDHAAVVWASVTSEGQVTQVHRIGLRALITVADGTPAAGFEIERVEAHRAADGAESVAVTVANTGGRMLEVAGTVDLHDGPGGVAAGELPLQPSTIRTGATATLHAGVDPDLPAGDWEADVDVVANRLSDSASATVTLGGVAPVDDAGPSQAALAGVAALLLLLTLVALLAAWRSRQDEEHVGA